MKKIDSFTMQLAALDSVRVLRLIVEKKCSTLQFFISKYIKMCVFDLQNINTF